jgi:Zn-dependent protease
MGDSTAKWLGRLTLNPVKHLDLFGSLMLLIVGFGWAKPVPVNLENIPADNRRKGIILISVAGITANIICAFIIEAYFSRTFGNNRTNSFFAGQD